jgi:hypothetical protein
MSERTCTLPGCPKKEFARGWCHMHWNRWRRNGDPTVRHQIQGDDRARILSLVDRSPSGCWIWRGQLNPNGYGRLLFRGRKDYAHRAAFEIFVGPIGAGLDIDHECHNVDPSCAGGDACPHRACVNPGHLIQATKQHNRGKAGRRSA